MEETNQEFIVRRSAMNNMLELLITNYLYNETVQTIIDYCPSVALSSIPGAVKYVFPQCWGEWAWCWVLGGGDGGLLAIIDYGLYNDINTAAADKH